MFNEHQIQRFWSKVRKGSADECWEWTGAPDRDGYGELSFGDSHGPNRQRFKAHRFSYQLHYGVDPTGKVVMHVCDNPPCVNPHHLGLGTHRDNLADMRRKGRDKSPGLPGLTNPNSIITPDMAHSIRHDYRVKHLAPKALVQKYGVSEGAVYCVLSGRHWTVSGSPNLSKQRRQGVI